MTESGENSELEKVIQRDFDDFQRMCPEGQSPVLSVLRAHLFIEYYMERAFHLALPRGDKIANRDLSYAQKISLLESLDVAEDRTLQCLKNLNKVRNRCAHEYDKIITVADVELIGRSLGREHTEIRREHVDNVGSYLREILECICRDMASLAYGLEQSVLGDDEDDE